MSILIQRIVLLAGESSGDAIGEGLVREIKKQYPNSEIYGMGGDLMIQAGLKPWAHIDQLSVMGILEVVKKLPSILKLRKFLLQKIIKFKPDILIGIDSPDFNLWLEHKIKAQNNIPTIHYVSPTIWAWKPGRITKIMQATSSVLCVFPFEPEIYQQAGHRAVFIGHPLADQIAHADFVSPLVGETARQAAGLLGREGVMNHYFAILPGSREFEIKNLLPIFLDSAAGLKKDFPDLKFVLPIARASLKNLIQEIITQAEIKHPNLINSIGLINNQAQQAFSISKAAVLASGTITLEAALLNIPSVVAYRLSKFSYWLGKKLIKLKFISLPNILLNQEVFKELIQDDLTINNLYQAMRDSYLLGCENKTHDFSIKLKSMLIDEHYSASQKALQEIEHVLLNYRR